MSPYLWIVLLAVAVVALLVLGVCALFAWREPVRRGEVLDFTPRRGKR